MAIAQVQKGRARATSSAPSATFASGPTQNNLLIATLGITEAGTTVTPPSGWTAAVEGGAVEDPFGGIYFKVAGASEDTVVTFSTLLSHVWRLHIFEYSGLATTGVLDQTSTVRVMASATITSTAVTTTVADELLVAASATDANAAADSTWSDSFIEQQEDDASIRLFTAHRIVAATGSYQTTFAKVGENRDRRLTVATFEATGGAPPAAVPMRSLMGVGT